LPRLACGEWAFSKLRTRGARSTRQGANDAKEQAFFFCFWFWLASLAPWRVNFYFFAAASLDS
jgi:hypothetical protein